VANLKLSCRVGRAFVVAKKNHLDVWMHKYPALQRISLGNTVVPRKRFGGREKRKHFRPVRILLRQPLEIRF
jgi:hypothetical protein